jgi:hypothetical protein
VACQRPARDACAGRCPRFGRDRWRARSPRRIDRIGATVATTLQVGALIAKVAGNYSEFDKDARVPWPRSVQRPRGRGAGELGGGRRDSVPGRRYVIRHRHQRV